MKGVARQTILFVSKVQRVWVFFMKSVWFLKYHTRDDVDGGKQLDLI